MQQSRIYSGILSAIHFQIDIVINLSLNDLSDVFMLSKQLWRQKNASNREVNQQD